MIAYNESTGTRHLLGEIPSGRLRLPSMIRT
jgi:hypothetical protein